MDEGGSTSFLYHRVTAFPLSIFYYLEVAKYSPHSRRVGLKLPLLEGGVAKIWGMWVNITAVRKEIFEVIGIPCLSLKRCPLI